MAESVSALATAFEQIALIRRFEERLLDLHAKEIFGSTHLSCGQEAVAIGACSALDRDDLVVATYRGHHWALARGVPPAALFAELAGRQSGTNAGRGGSAFLSAPDYGLVGENSIVGAGLPIADGLALAAQLRGKSTVVVAAFGDGATNQGAAFEGLIFAIARTLPVVFICENNGWSEMTPISSIVPVELADRVRAMGMPALKVDGSDITAVREAVADAVERGRAGEGPTFVEPHTRRLVGHYQWDVEHYRPREDRERAVADDVFARVRRALVDAGGEGAATAIEQRVDATLARAERDALATAPADVATVRSHVYTDVRRSQAQPLPNNGQKMTYIQAVNAGLRAELAGRPETLLYGEDVAIPGGVFGASKALLNEFGADRVFDTPIAEAAILGSAIGAAISGMRPIVEIMFGDFLLVALDQLVNQAANVAYLSSGRASCPIVVRTQQAITPGSCAQHSQSLEAILAHIPGLRIGLPSTPQDAYTMLRAAVACDDPVILYESRALYTTDGVVDLQQVDDAVGGARLLRAGSDLAIVTWGRMTHVVRDAADKLAERGLSAAVLDLRWLNPLDEELLYDTVRGCARALIVHEANLTGGFGAEIVARVVGTCFFDLDGPPARLALPDVRVPAAPALQDALLPSAQTIIDTAMQMAAT